MYDQLLRVPVFPLYCSGMMGMDDLAYTPVKNTHRVGCSNHTTTTFWKTAGRPRRIEEVRKIKSFVTYL